MARVGHDTLVLLITNKDKLGTIHDATTLEVVATSPALKQNDVAIVVDPDLKLTSTITDLSFLIAGDEIILTGFTSVENNGRYIVDTDGTRFDVALTKEDALVPVAEAAGNQICITTESYYIYDGVDPVIVRDAEGLYSAYIPTTHAGDWKLEIIANDDLGGGRSLEKRRQIRRKLKDNYQERL